MREGSYVLSTRIFTDGAWRSLLGGFLVHVALGTVYCWASNTAYITSAIREKHHYVTYSLTFPTYVCILAFQGMFNPCGGFLEQRYGAQKTVLMGGSVVVAATFLAFPAIVLHSLVLLYATAGMLFGLGSALVYTIPIVCSYRWLPNHKGLVSGVIVAGYGAGALVFDQVSTAYTNPENVALQSGDDDLVDDDLWSGYINCDAKGGSRVCSRASSLYLLLGCCYTGLILFGALLIGEPLEPLEQIKDDAGIYEALGDDATVDICTGEQTDVAVASVTESLAVENPQSIGELLQSTTMRLTTLNYILTATPGVFIAGSYKVIASQYFNDDRFLTNVGSGASVGNCLGRLFWGWASDRFGWNTAIITLSSVQTFLILSYRLVASSDNESMFSFWTAFIYFNYGGNFAIYPVAITELFGRDRCGINYGVVYGIYGFICAIVLLFLTFLIDPASPLLTYSLAVIQGGGVVSGLALRRHRANPAAS